MSKLKNIYKGKCLGDLAVFYQTPLKHCKGRKVDMLCKTAQRLIQEAEKCSLDGDEEQSYIHYMTYMGIMAHMRSLPNYTLQKQYISEMMGGGAKQRQIIDKCEQLSKSLQKRYEANAETINLSTIEEQIAMQHSLRDQIKTSGAPLSEAEKNKQRNQQDNISLILAKQSLNCHELYAQMSNQQTSMLIMDCRAGEEFSKSQLKYDFVVSIPEESLMPGMSAGKLQAELSEAGKYMWAQRGTKQHIVLIDLRTKGPDPVRNTALWRLRDILENWDQDVVYKSLKIVEEGYENVLLHYPMMCTNPSYKPPHAFVDDQDVQIDGIEYPSMNDITMKDTSFGLSSPSSMAPKRPGINRDSKIVALQTYQEKEKQVSEILAAQEQLSNKSLATEKERVVVETEWGDAHLQKENVNTEEEKLKLEQLEKKYEYELMQLENKQKDYISENDALREELEMYKKKEVQHNLDKEKAITELAAQQRIKEKERQRLELDQQRQRLEENRHRQLQIARDQKRHNNEIMDDENVSRPKMPQFDRTVKPTAVLRDCNENVNRDFAPVYGCPNRGLTGLKNLGNTCYMNSIMQCLSNTPCLVEYIIDNAYVGHINRKNKTQGRIIEEVAAVIKALWRGQFKFIASKDLRYVIGEYEQIFRGIEQQDSHEFLTILMDWLHSDLQTIPNKVSNVSTLPASEKAWQEYTKSKESLILQIFYGQIKSTVKCTHCRKESATYESFSNLSLELPQNSNRCKIQDCLGMYFYGETIYGWDCPNCKTKRNAVKKLDISKLPPILVVHFKRFYADPDSISYRKKQNYVNFPLTELDMAQYVAPSERKHVTQGKHIYNLYAVSNHYGSMESGHYTAFCRSSVAKKWYKFDDHMVSQLDQSDVESSAAYILFYSHLPDRPPPSVKWS